MLTIGFLLVGVLLVGIYAAAQVPAGCLMTPHELPDDLRTALEQRLSIFHTAQAEQDWSKVAELLGRCHFECTSGFLYSDTSKQCLVSRMKEVRMLDFDFSAHAFLTCSTRQELPAGTVPRFAAEQLVWHLRGTGKFQTASTDWIEETQIIAYRDQDQWYFIPPQRDMQHQWEKVNFTSADFDRDRQEEIEIQNDPSVPIEITDVHVYMDRQYPSLRNVKFTLRNRTSKKVIALSMKLGDESGAAYLTGPYEIEPQKYVALEETVSAYVDRCDGLRRHAVAIEEVDFADGSTWKFKQPARQKDN